VFRELILATALGAALAACSRDPSSLDGGAPGADAGLGTDAASTDAAAPSGDAGAVGDDASSAFSESTKRRVQFKRQRRLLSDFAAALALAPADVCKELDRYDCVTEVHAIPLGGVEPYQLGLYSPPEVTSKSTPIAVERVALVGCRSRVDLDLATPDEAVVWKGLRLDTDGKLADPAQPELDASLDALYERFVQREPSAQERAALRALYAELPGDEPRPGRAWAILACFAVATGVESLFY
jgi:hypothetical protein